MITEEEVTRQEIEKLFKKWEQLLQPAVPIQESAPKYSAKKRKIPIQEYLKRLQKSKAQLPKPESPKKEEKQKKIGGNAVKSRKLIAENYQKFHLTGNKAEKSKILDEIRIIRNSKKIIID